MHCLASWRARGIGAGALIFALAPLAACQDATSIELQISTDLPCEAVKVVTTSISSGSLATYESRPPSAVTTRCDEASGHIGSLVLVPSDDDTAEVAVRVVTARSSHLPDQCITHPSPECIVARRVVRFSPHRMLTLPIRMQNVCAGVTCAAGETCTDGKCVSAVVTPEALQLAEDDDAGALVVDAGAPPPVSTPPPVDAGTTSTPPPPPPPHTDRDAGTKDDKGGKDKPPKNGGGANNGTPFSDAGVTPAPSEPPPAHGNDHDAGASPPPPPARRDAGTDASDDGNDKGDGGGGKKPPKAPKTPK